MICSHWPKVSAPKREKKGTIWLDLDNTLIYTVYEDPKTSELYKGIMESKEPQFYSYWSRWKDGAG